MIRPELADERALHIFDGVVSHLELAYATPPGFRPLVLELHVPQPRDGVAVPVVVYTHGGGFFGGTRAMGPWAFLLAAGYAVASVDYRLNGEARFPGPVHDLAAAVRWIRARAGDYGLDPDRVAGFGSSAGAYLVNAVALAGDDHPDLTGSLGPTPGLSCRLAAVIDHHGPADFLTFDDDAGEDIMEPANAPGTSAARVLGFVPADRPAAAERANLCRYATAASPPFLIAHGDADRRVGIGQSRRLHAALTSAEARAELIVVPDGDHGSAEFDQPYGTTVSAFASLSLQPPMVLVSLDLGSDLLALMRQSGRFGLNVLSSSQTGLALNFARKGGAGKFAGVPWEVAAAVPRIPEATGFVACTVGELVAGGDHVVVFGHVLMATSAARPPLTYQARVFGAHAPVLPA